MTLLVFPFTPDNDQCNGALDGSQNTCVVIVTRMKSIQYSSTVSHKTVEIISSPSGDRWPQ